MKLRTGIVGLVVAGLLVAFALAAFASPFASSKPDGLEKVAADKGFLKHAQDSATADSPLADYGVERVSNARVSTGLAGVLGVAITLAVAGGVFGGIRYAVRRRDARDPVAFASSRTTAG
jgi:cobalt/nickel transport system permease protein